MTGEKNDIRVRKYQQGKGIKDLLCFEEKDVFKAGEGTGGIFILP